MAIGIRVIEQDQAATESQIAGDGDPVADAVLGIVGIAAGRSEFEDTLRATREEEAARDGDRADRVTRSDISRDGHGTVGGTSRDRAVTREGLVGLDREAIRVGRDVEGSTRIGEAEVDIGRGCDRPVGGERQYTRSDIGRPGVAVGDSDRGRARADLPERAGASHDIGERVGITPIEYQCAVVGDGSRPEGAVCAVCPQLQGAIAADHGRHVAIAAEQGECSGTDLRQRSRSRDRVGQAVEA